MKVLKLRIKRDIPVVTFRTYRMKTEEELISEYYLADVTKFIHHLLGIHHANYKTLKAANQHVERIKSILGKSFDKHALKYVVWRHEYWKKNDNDRSSHGGKIYIPKIKYITHEMVMEEVIEVVDDEIGSI